MKTILVTGASGQLANCIKDLEQQYSNFCFVYKSSLELNISDFSKTTNFFKTNKVDWCINCAAYTAVDNAESDIKNANNVNVIGAKNIAIACNENNVKLVHISTDFVFDGNTTTAYTEKDPTNPLGVYGSSKLIGEQEIASHIKTYYIIRTSWLYSEHGNNFLKTMLRLANNNKKINVINDQIGTPTYAKDLAKIILEIIKIDNNNFGVYNYSNEGVASWYDFAKAIFDISNLKIKINPIPTINYPTPAKRPNFSVLNKTKIKETFQLDIPHWRDSLILAISRIK